MWELLLRSQMIDKDNYQDFVINEFIREDEIAPDPTPTISGDTCARGNTCVVTLKTASEEDLKRSDTNSGNRR